MIKINQIKHRYSNKVLARGETIIEAAENNKADLRDAYLGGANLGGANLRGADLKDVINPPISDHYFTSEILFRHAKFEREKNFAARVRIELSLCWEDSYKLAKRMKVVTWATKTLSKWPEYEEKIKEIKAQ